VVPPDSAEMIEVIKLINRLPLDDAVVSGAASFTLRERRYLALAPHRVRSA